MTDAILALAKSILLRSADEPITRGEAVALALRLEQLEKALSDAAAQLYAVHSVHETPFLKGAIGSALQAINGARE